MEVKIPENNHVPEISRKDILKTAGGSRAVASGMYSLIFTFASTAVLWIFLVVGSGSDGLAYNGLNGSVNGIVGIVSAGFSQGFISQVKENVIKDPRAAVRVASIYTRILVIYGIIASIVLVLLTPIVTYFASFSTNPENFETLEYALLSSAPQTLLNYCFLSPMFWSLQVANRYDITSFVGALGGGGSLFLGIAFIYSNAPVQIFAFLGTFNALLNLPLVVIFFKRHSPFKLTELWKSTKLREDRNATRQILKYGGLTTLSNMETFQLISNVNYFLFSISLNFLFSVDEVNRYLRILTIINIYSQLKSALTLFASPLNVELAEAYAKDDHPKMTEILNNTVKFSYFVGLALVTGFCGLSGIILRELHYEAFVIMDVFQMPLYDSALLVAIIMSLGQAGFGVANLFANALIGTEKAAISAKVYIFALIASGILTPFCIVVLQLGFTGIAWSTLIVGIITGLLMQHEVRKHLNVDFHSHLRNMLPLFTLLFLIVYFVPYGRITGIVFPDIAIAIALMVIIYILGLSFFGVFQDEGDWKVLHDMYVSLGMHRFADGLVRLAKFMYNLNPFHHQHRIDWRKPRHTPKKE